MTGRRRRAQMRKKKNFIFGDKIEVLKDFDADSIKIKKGMVLAVIEVDEDEDICVNQVNGRKIKDVWIWEEDGGYEYLQKIEEIPYPIEVRGRQGVGSYINGIYIGGDGLYKNRKYYQKRDKSLYIFWNKTWCISKILGSATSCSLMAFDANKSDVSCPTLGTELKWKISVGNLWEIDQNITVIPYCSDKKIQSLQSEVDALNKSATAANISRKAESEKINNAHIMTSFQNKSIQSLKSQVDALNKTATAANISRKEESEKIRVSLDKSIQSLKSQVDALNESATEANISRKEESEKIKKAEIMINTIETKLKADEVNQKSIDVQKKEDNQEIQRLAQIEKKHEDRIKSLEQELNNLRKRPNKRPYSSSNSDDNDDRENKKIRRTLPSTIKYIGDDDNDDGLGITPYPKENNCPSLCFDKLPMGDWDLEHVGQFLDTIRLHCYKESFQTKCIDGETLLYLDKESLKALGVNMWHLEKLLKHILLWKEKV